MMKFKVEVTEHYQKVYEIEAESEDEVYDLVRSDEYMPSSYECDDCTYWCDRKIEEVRLMKYKVGDKVKFVKDWSLTDGRVMYAKSVWGVSDISEEHYLLRCVENNLFVMLKHKTVDDNCEKINTAPSITKRINDKHNILNGLLNSDGSVDGEKLMEKLESNSEEAKKKGSHYEKAAMQPLEVMQRIMTTEQFKGFLLGNYIKYRMRSNFKGQHASDEYKARQYAYWLEMVKEGRIINPSKDKVPFDYKFSII